MQEVDVQPVSLDRVGRLLTPERQAELQRQILIAQGLMADRVLWSINATAHGGGVAEMLQSLLAYSRASGVDARWLVLDGNAEFFAVTKRLHNALHGSHGDGGALGEGERAVYEKVLRDNVESLTPQVRSGDVVLLHDPQTAGLVEDLRARGAHVIWRCHVGRDTTDDVTDSGWAFLRPYIEEADAFVFSRREYAPLWMPSEKLCVIQPTIDPFSVKNQPLDASSVRAALLHAGLATGHHEGDDLGFIRRDGSKGSVRAHDDLVVDGPPPPIDAPLVVQVSRWDRLKDMPGVLLGFTDAVAGLPDDTHLMLVGPEVSGVTDDPEGAEVLAECRALWQGLSEDLQRRTHLACLPMDDGDENAHLVNALQRHASVVVQKSIVEGFGLTVTEAMWKGRPVIASAVGGINDQIADGRDGLLLADPHDLATFGSLLSKVLNDRRLALRLAYDGQARIQDRFLADRQLIQYVELFGRLFY